MPETTQSERIFKGRVVSLRLDQVRMEDGRMLRQEVVENRRISIEDAVMRHSARATAS